MSSKLQRQQTIARLISEHDVTSQPMLVELLEAEGITATQATVSRDLDDLGAVKVRIANGDTAYAIPEFEPERVAPLDQLRRVLAEWVAEVHHSEPVTSSRTRRTSKPMLSVYARSVSALAAEKRPCHSGCPPVTPVDPSFDAFFAVFVAEFFAVFVIWYPAAVRGRPLRAGRWPACVRRSRSRRR